MEPTNSEVQIPELTCKVCNYKWTPRVGAPKVCPRCKHRDWKEERSGVEDKAPEQDTNQEDETMK